jgi:hypothetical protein
VTSPADASRLGIGPLDFDQRIDAGAALRHLIGTQLSSL